MSSPEGLENTPLLIYQPEWDRAERTKLFSSLWIGIKEGCN
jgi:hypothetical protein